MMKTVNILVRPDIYQDAFGPMGTSGDPEKIIHYATRLVGYYRDCIEWVLDVRRKVVDPVFERLLEITAQFPLTVLADIERFVKSYRLSLVDLISNPPSPGEIRKITVGIEFTAPDELNQEMEAELAHVAVLLQQMTNVEE